MIDPHPLAADRWTRVQDLFLEALERPPVDRPGFLAEACGGDATLEAEVEALLAAHERGGPVASLDDRDEDAPATLPASVGPYRVLERLGEGGMGTVYLAERVQEDFRQRVALKVMRAGFTDPLLEERLRLERRILAALEHPGIARLIDGGATAVGQPYYAMEYVEGTNLITYCETNRLTTSQRLRLFLEICAAVQYAHRQLVVHRDLKPSNILVGADGHPKLLDFGIAKLLDPTQGLMGATATQHPVFTPAYASPEQVRGQAVGTSSDVYSLGVLLYEVLTGHKPYSIDTPSPAEIEQIVCQQLPERPSVRVTRATLRKRLTGDLDTILLKVLAKEPTRRYESVDHFADDIRRHLERRPVLARPDSITYRVGKFVQRHRNLVAVGSLAVVSLVGGVLVSAWQARRATEERDRAADEAAKAALVTNVMVDLFRLSDPTATLGDTVTAREILDRGTERVEDEFGAQPELQAAVFAEVARVYANLGLLDRGEALARRALALREELLGPQNRETSAALGLLGNLLAAQGRDSEAIATYRRGIAIRTAVLRRPDSLLANMQASLGWVLRDVGEHEAAAELFEQALATQRRSLTPNHPDVAQSMFGLAAAYHDRGRFDDAERLFERALADYDTARGRPHPMAATALTTIGMIRRLREQYVQAEPILRSANGMRRALYGPDHPEALQSALQLGILLSELGRYAEAEALLVDGLVRANRTLGADHPDAISLRVSLAILYRRVGRYAEAISRYDTNLTAKRLRLPPEHPDIVFSQLRAAEPHLEMERLDEAERRFRTVEAGLGTEAGVTRLLTLHGLGRVAHARGRHDEAVRLLDSALAIAAERLRDDHRYTVAARRDRAAVILEIGRVDEARSELEDVLAAERRVRPEPHDRIGHTLYLLGDAHLAAGDPQRAERALRAALANFAELPPFHWRIGAARSLLGAALRWLGREDEAVPLLVDGLETIRQHLGPGSAAARRAEALLAGSPPDRR